MRDMVNNPLTTFANAGIPRFSRAGIAGSIAGAERHAPVVRVRARRGVITVRQEIFDPVQRTALFVERVLDGNGVFRSDR
jgi:hypothetical protein